MKPTLLLIAFTLLGTDLRSGAEEPIATPAITPVPAKVFLIDDQTGDELSGNHGIQPITTNDLAALIDGVVSTQREVVLLHELVDEDASDNEVRSLTLRPYRGDAPPTKPSKGLALRQLALETEHYRAKRAVWLEGILLYREQLVMEVEGYVRELTEAQLDLTERFDEILRSRNGRDFNRSDVSGTVLSAGRQLGREGLRIAILNTDAKDLPAGKASRLATFTPEELDPGIVLLWVNTSGEPQRVSAFAGLGNRSHHVPNMAEAMSLIRQLLGGKTDDDATPEPVGAGSLSER